MGEADAPSFVAAQVDDDPAPGLLDHGHGSVQLWTAVASQGTEDVAGQALAVHPDQHVGLAGHLPFDHGHVVLAVQHRLVGVDGELAVVGRDAGVGEAPDQLVLAAAVTNEVGDGDEVEPVALGKGLELVEAGHPRLVLAHHLAEHAGGRHAGGSGQVDGRLGVAGTLQHAARPVAQAGRCDPGG